jgi:hypothetical protein
MCYFCFPEHVPERFGLAAHGIEQSHDFVMGMDRFHIDGKQVFLLLTGWLKHSVATLLNAPMAPMPSEMTTQGTP